jgi:hypothetical protein
MLDDGALADQLDEVLYDAVQRTFERLWTAFYEAFGYATHVASPPPGGGEEPGGGGKNQQDAKEQEKEKETGGGKRKQQDTAEEAMENQKHPEEEGEQEINKDKKDALFGREREREVGEGGESERASERAKDSEREGVVGLSENVLPQTLSESVRLLMSALSDLIHIVLAGAP